MSDGGAAFEALFILTTVDAGTRVERFMLQDTLGNVWKPMSRPSWKPGVWATSAIVLAAWVLPLRRRDRPARRHQPALPAVRDRQPAAGGGRPHGGHDHPDQVRPGALGLGDGGAARLGRGRPLGQLGLYVVAAVVLGVVAAIWPAQRAARMDVLRAIATE
jgi:Carbon starvation protein CstA